MSTSSSSPSPTIITESTNPTIRTPSVATSTSSSSSSSYLVSSYFISGAVAGAASRTSVAPLERIKILQQCQGNNRAYTGVWASLRKIWLEEGVKGMFRGNGINCLRIMPYSAVQFTSYEQFKKLFTDDGQKPLDTPLRLTAGALAGICSVVSTYPLDLVRSRISIATASISSAAVAAAAVSSSPSGAATLHISRPDLSIVGMTLKVFREEGGLRGLYRGIGPTAAGVAPYVGLNFTFYALFKDYFTPPDQPATALRKLSCGALAGAISQTLTYPLDVLRRKMQVTGMKDKVDFAYKNSFDAIRTIVEREGLRGLYTGLYVNLLKVSPAMGISFLSYETTKQWLST